MWSTSEMRYNLLIAVSKSTAGTICYVTGNVGNWALSPGQFQHCLGFFGLCLWFQFFWHCPSMINFFNTVGLVGQCQHCWHCPISDIARNTYISLKCHTGGICNHFVAEVTAKIPTFHYQYLLCISHNFLLH